MARTSSRIKRPTAKAAVASTPGPSARPRKRSSTASKAVAKGPAKRTRVATQSKAKVPRRPTKPARASMRVPEVLISPSSRTAVNSAPSSPSSSSSRSRSSTTAVEAQRATPSTSRSTTRTPSKRKAAPVEETPSRTLKRKRPSTVDKEEQLRAKAEELKQAAKSARQREIDVKKREAAVLKKHNAVKRAELSLGRDRAALKKREETILIRRRDVDLKFKELAAEKKKLAGEMLTRRAQREATSSAPGSITESHWAVAHLEENYTCSLCYEVMACPYTLVPGRCGHSFCAICILQWCFAAVHRGCGYWHDSLECPLCRAELPYTSDVTPRSLFSFPFNPNRLADGAIQALVLLARDAKPEQAGACSQRGAPSSEGDKLAAWREGGAMYDDWLERDRRGREEMTLLANEWETLQAEDFVAFKDRLGV